MACVSEGVSRCCLRRLTWVSSVIHHSLSSTATMNHNPPDPRDIPNPENFSVNHFRANPDMFSGPPHVPTNASSARCAGFFDPNTFLPVLRGPTRPAASILEISSYRRGEQDDTNLCDMFQNLDCQTPELGVVESVTSNGAHMSLQPSHLPQGFDSMTARQSDMSIQTVRGWQEDLARPRGGQITSWPTDRFDHLVSSAETGEVESLAGTNCMSQMLSARSSYGAESMLDDMEVDEG